MYKAYLSSWSKYYLIPGLVMALNLSQQGMVVSSYKVEKVTDSTVSVML